MTNAATLETKLYLATKRGLKCQVCGCGLKITFKPQWEDIKPCPIFLIMGDNKDHSALLHHKDCDRGHNSHSNYLLVCKPCHLILHGRGKGQIDALGKRLWAGKTKESLMKC